MLGNQKDVCTDPVASIAKRGLNATQLSIPLGPVIWLAASKLGSAATRPPVSTDQTWR